MYTKFQEIAEDSAGFYEFIDSCFELHERTILCRRRSGNIE